MFKHTLFYGTSFIALCTYCVFFNKLKVCANAVSGKSINAVLPKAYACVSVIFLWLSHFKLFHHYICYGDLGSLMLLLSLFWGAINNAHMMAKLIDKHGFWLPHQPALPHLSLLWLPYFLRHSNIETRPINNLTTASKCESDRKSHTFLLLKARNS